MPLNSNLSVGGCVQCVVASGRETGEDGAMQDTLVVNNAYRVQTVSLAWSTYC